MVNDKDVHPLKKNSADIGEFPSRESVPLSSGEREDISTESRESILKESDDLEQSRLRQEIEKMDVDDSLKIQIQDDAATLSVLDEEKKIKHLLILAEKKGIVWAVKAAQQMNNPYLLDKFHDLLIEKGYYRQFVK